MARPRVYARRNVSSSEVVKHRGRSLWLLWRHKEKHISCHLSRFGKNTLASICKELLEKLPHLFDAPVPHCG
jgi:hypothetical protein